MPIKLTDSQVKKMLKEIIGRNAYLILNACQVGRTDEEIARITKLEIPTIRSLLNQLHSEGLITYTREKDEEHNWFKYTWYTRKDMIADVLKLHLEEDIQDLERKLDFETSYIFFTCPNGCIKAPFEIAAEYDFRCPDCGSPLRSYNNKKEIMQIKHELNEKKRLLRQLERYQKEKIKARIKKTKPKSRKKKK